MRKHIPTIAVAVMSGIVAAFWIASALTSNGTTSDHLGIIGVIVAGYFIIVALTATYIEDTR